MAKTYSSGFDRLHAEPRACDDVGPCMHCQTYSNAVSLLHWEHDDVHVVLRLCGACIRTLHTLLHLSGEVDA